MGKQLVTGGCGFIGSHLVDLLLQEGHDVVVIDNLSTGRRANLEHHRDTPRLKLIEADIAHTPTLEQHFGDVDCVFHLASLADIVPSIENPLAYHRSNVDGTVNVLLASHKHQVNRFIYASSSSCYGIPDLYPTPESAAIRPRYPYALTKYVAEEYVLHWGQVYGLPVVALRLFNVYGPRSRTGGTYGAVFGVFLKQKLAHKPFTIVGDGTQTRDFIFVTDVARAFYAAARSEVRGEVFNVGSGQTYSINLLADLLHGERVYIPKRPGEPDVTHADITRITTMLNWKPEISFQRGTESVLAHIDYWKDAPLWDKDSIAAATKSWFHYLS